MAMGNTLATQVAVPQINTVANFQASQANQQNMAAQKQQMEQSALEQKRKGMEGIYMMSAGMLRDGEVNPDEWEQGLDLMAQGGSDPAFIETLRGKPELAKVLAQGSAEALKFSQNEQLMDLEIQKMAAALEAAQAPPPPVEVSAGATMWDPTTKQPLFTAPTQKDSQPPDIIEIYDEQTGRKQKGYMNGDEFVPVGGAEAEAAPKPPDTFGNEKDLFQQYSSSDPVKTYEIVRNSYERVRESASQQSGAGDLGLIYGYMRMLDPTSVVRESEFAMAAQAGDYGEQIQGFVTRILNGQRLPESQRQEFLKSASSLYKATADNLSSFNEQFKARVEGAGVVPGRILRDPEAYEDTGTDSGVTDWTDYFD